MRHLFPWESLPDGEANGDGWIEVSTGGRGAGDDSEGDTDGEAPADCKDTTESGNANGGFEIEGEGGDCCYSGEAV